MANEEQIAILREGVDGWNRWRKENPDVRPDLSDANLLSADLNDTVFADVDLSELNGLETVRHNGPSSIGIDTIYKSRGQIPDIFLRGCGVPDIFIEYMRALTSKPFEFYSCFISYAHADEAFATRLHDTLQGKGIRCWLDEEDAKLGVPVARNIEKGIQLTDKATSNNKVYGKSPRHFLSKRVCIL